MSDAVLALDAGTTSVRALVIAPDGTVLGRARAPFTLSYPVPGHVEQDPKNLWETTVGVLKAAIKEAGLSPSDLRAIGIATQRSCCIVWERATGAAVSPLVSWQDLRGFNRAVELMNEGFPVFPQSATAKLEAVLEGIEDGPQRMRRGELAWGNVDSFLAWGLSGGEVHITDASQACATGYFDYESGQWMEPLLAFQKLEPDFFPAICDTAGELGRTAKSVLGAELPIGSIIGDQQSAAIGQGCRTPGEGKVTFGTSGTGNVHTGPDIFEVAGTYPLVLMRREGTTVYCLEGMVMTAGAVFDWLATGLGALEEPAQAAELAATVDDTHGVYVLPAFQGLGSPYFDLARRATIGGLTRGATKAHIARAAMEGVAFRVREMLDQVYNNTPWPRPAHLRVDGGAAANDVFMQIQANVLGQPVERMAPLEATAFGAALLAGKACGFWGTDAVETLRRVDRIFEPQWSDDERNTRFEHWRTACGLAT